MILRPVDEGKLPDEGLPPGVYFASEDGWPLQVAFLSHNAGGGCLPHHHPPVTRTMTGTPELLLVMGGSYRLDLFTAAGVPISSHQLGIGTMVMIQGGGHSVTALVDESVMFEVKVGPYLGKHDKVRFVPQPVPTPAQG